MRSRLLVLVALLPTAVAATPIRPASQAPGYAEITRPAPGEAVVGLVTIWGTAYHPSLDHFDLAFAYEPNPTDTWFPIGDPGRSAVRDARLALWDTSGISDGTYTLRLQVWTSDGTVLAAQVRGVRVRNQRPAETNTPGPQPAAGTTPTHAPATPTPGPSLLPTPADGQTQVTRSLLLGAVSAAVGLALLAVYTGARRVVRHGWSSVRMRRLHGQADRVQRRRRRRA
jgi:hypothetical protein